MAEGDPRLSDASPFPTTVGIEAEHSACTAAIAWIRIRAHVQAELELDALREELGVTPDWNEAD